MSSFTPTPYTVLVRDLIHRPGEFREKSLDIVVPGNLGEGVVSVKEGSELSIDLQLESLHDGILVSASVEGEATGECVRCLRDITIPVEVEFQELFAYSFDEAFDYTVRDDHVDLEPVVRDAVVLSLPFQPVCEPDCPGLDPVTGERLADIPDRKLAEVPDPRWSALAGLKAALDENGAETGAAEEKR